MWLKNVNHSGLQVHNLNRTISALQIDNFWKAFVYKPQAAISLFSFKNGLHGQRVCGVVLLESNSWTMLVDYISSHLHTIVTRSNEWNQLVITSLKQ